jgi:hypothetical protein
MASDKKKEKELTTEQKRYISRKVVVALEEIDLSKWAEACKGFGPFNYNEITRRQWFEKHKSKVKTGREILDFVEKLKSELGKDDKLKGVVLGSIKESIVDAIRDEQTKRKIEQYRLNTIKLSTFSTLILWADNPKKLDEGPYEGKLDIPPDKKQAPKISRRGRKAAKGTFGAPGVVLDRDIKISAKTIELTVVLINNYLHPYQNVELELELDSNLSVVSTKPYKWSPKDQRVIIGYIPASLDVNPNEITFTIELEQKTKATTYSISGTIHYDNTDKGKRVLEKLTKVKVKIN